MVESMVTDTDTINMTEHISLIEERTLLQNNNKHQCPGGKFKKCKKLIDISKPFCFDHHPKRYLY